MRSYTLVCNVRALHDRDRIGTELGYNGQMTAVVDLCSSNGSMRGKTLAASFFCLIRGWEGRAERPWHF
jgi:hypothetical protein